MNRLRVTCGRPGTEGQKSVCEIEFRRARTGIAWASTPRESNRLCCGVLLLLFLVCEAVLSYCFVFYTSF